MLTTVSNLDNTLAEVTEPEMIAEPLPAAITAVEPPAAIDAENAFWKPPNCPFVEAEPCQIDCSVACATNPPT